MDKQQGNEGKVYEPPAIIYEGELTVRAGSVVPGPGPKDDWDVSPEKLFGGGA